MGPTGPAGLRNKGVDTQRSSVVWMERKGGALSRRGNRGNVSKREREKNFRGRVNVVFRGFGNCCFPVQGMKAASPPSAKY